MSDLTYISLGCGVQSSVMYLMSCSGDLPRADIAIFADVGDEPSYVYDHLKYLKTIGNIPIKVVSAGHLSKDALAASKGQKRRFACIPAFTRDENGKVGMLMRQCTHDYKIVPIQRAVRELLGYAKGKWVKKQATALIGISTDEVTRCKDSRTSWITNSYPLIDRMMSRGDCYMYLKKNFHKIPHKSACIFCPFHDEGSWRILKQDYPKEFAKAVEFDKKIRNMTKSGIQKPIYIHRSCVPLDEVNFGEDQLNLFENECEGMCGV